MNKLLKIASAIFLIIICLLLLLFFIRFFNPRELDDISPEIQCDVSLIKKSDILWVIPEFNNNSIAKNMEWCSFISSLNKTLGMHGVTHKYKEFEAKTSENYIQAGIKDFEKCFNEKPTMFKAPQLAISAENKETIKKEGLEIKGLFNQVLRKVYHCSSTGKYSNKIIDIF